MNLESRTDERVCAVVVTFKRQDLLVRCLRALQEQSRKVDHILVVDNASHDGTVERVRAEFPQVEVLELTHNVGGAGGFHDGMKHAYEQGYDWLWIMDDDGAPAPDCLQKLLAPDDAVSVRVPVQEQSSGRQYGYNRWFGRGVGCTEAIIAGQRAVRGSFIFAFVGPLISRRVVDAVGLPIHEFFIWLDDFEYALRIQRHRGAHIILVPDAVFFHDYGTNARQIKFLGLTKQHSFQPPWKNYYAARNHLYIARQRGRVYELALFFLLQLALFLFDVAVEPDRWERSRFRFLGLFDGLTGRLGARVRPGAPTAKKVAAK